MKTSVMFLLAYSIIGYLFAIYVWWGDRKNEREHPNAIVVVTFLFWWIAIFYIVSGALQRMKKVVVHHPSCPARTGSGPCNCPAGEGR